MRIQSDRWIIVFIIILSIVLLPSCRETQSPQEGSSTANLAAASPLDAARLLHSFHEQREYGKIARLIVEDNRATTLRLLIALDDAIAANKSLRQTAETAYSGPQEEYWDLASMENNLGIFSKKVSFINVSYLGESARVTIQQGESVPLVHLTFVQHGAGWLLQPDPIPDQLPEALNELSRLLRVVEGDVARGASLNAYVDAFFYRVVPQMRRVAMCGEPKRAAVAARAVGDE